MADLQDGQDSSIANEPSADQGTEIINPDYSYSWEASEYVFHEKSKRWYTALVALAIVLEIVLALFGQWFSIAVVAVMTLAIFVYSRKAPRVLQYHLDNHGVSIDGKLSHYDDFRSFGVVEELGWQSVELEPAKRLIPRLSILCENDNISTIEEILSDHLPRLDRHPDWIERLTRYFKF